MEEYEEHEEIFIEANRRIVEKYMKKEAVMAAYRQECEGLEEEIERVEEIEVRAEEDK